jgi:hypothetical protein
MLQSLFGTPTPPPYMAMHVRMGGQVGETQKVTIKVGLG